MMNDEYLWKSVKSVGDYRIGFYVTDSAFRISHRFHRFHRFHRLG